MAHQSLSGGELESPSTEAVVVMVHIVCAPWVIIGKDNFLRIQTQWVKEQSLGWWIDLLNLCFLGSDDPSPADSFSNFEGD